MKLNINNMSSFVSVRFTNNIDFQSEVNIYHTVQHKEYYINVLSIYKR
jgi:hypothetical protein